MSYDSRDDDFKHVMPKRNLPGLIRSRISEANNSFLSPSINEGKDSNINLAGFPKEFFERQMTLKDKIDLVLDKKDINLKELAKILELDEMTLNKYILKEKLPKKVLINLSNYSSYPIEFFKIKSLQDLVK